MTDSIWPLPGLYLVTAHTPECKFHEGRIWANIFLPTISPVSRLIISRLCSINICEWICDTYMNILIYYIYNIHNIFIIEWINICDFHRREKSEDSYTSEKIFNLVSPSEKWMLWQRNHFIFTSLRKMKHDFSKC